MTPDLPEGAGVAAWAAAASKRSAKMAERAIVFIRQYAMRIPPPYPCLNEKTEPYTRHEFQPCPGSPVE